MQHRKTSLDLVSKTKNLEGGKNTLWKALYSHSHFRGWEKRQLKAIANHFREEEMVPVLFLSMLVYICVMDLISPGLAFHLYTVHMIYQFQGQFTRDLYPAS